MYDAQRKEMLRILNDGTLVNISKIEFDETIYRLPVTIHCTNSAGDKVIIRVSAEGQSFSRPQ